MSVATALSRVTGFVRTWAIAYALGATALASSYHVANNLPNMIFELVAGGILSALFIPTFFDDLEALRKHDMSIEKYVRHVESQPKLKDKDRLVLMDLAMGAFYDPDPTKFRCMRLPVDPHTGELIPERWANWLKHDPVVMFDEKGEELRKLKLIYMDCGNHDQFRIHFGMRRFSKPGPWARR